MENSGVSFVSVDGGPSSGKTTGLVAISERLLSYGFAPVIVPEAATFLIANGINPRNLGHVEFQKQIVSLQLRNEDYFSSLVSVIAAKQGKRPVALCDRGLLSGAAYFTEDGSLAGFQKEVLRHFQLTVESVRARYAGIIHMVTAADGAEEFYTTANNIARTETAEQARALDKKLQHVWLGTHPRIIGNTNKLGERITFEQKIDNVVAEVLRILGYPVPIEIEDKFLLKAFNPGALEVKYEALEIEQTYLECPEVNTEERVRKRTYAKSSSYFHTIKKTVLGVDGRPEIERSITRNEYNRLLMRRDLSRNPIRKTRYCFLWRDQYFEIDVLKGDRSGIIIAEREKTDRNDLTELPPFLMVDREVTNDPKYKNSSLALKV